jgi:hypothetical protein
VKWVNIGHHFVFVVKWNNNTNSYREEDNVMYHSMAMITTKCNTHSMQVIEEFHEMHIRPFIMIIMQANAYVRFDSFILLVSKKMGKK